MRRRLALCDELCGALEALYRVARALSASGLGAREDDARSSVRRAPASVHTVCSMVRDFADAMNRACELVEFQVDATADEPSLSVDSPVVPIVRKALRKALDEHAALRCWKDAACLGLSCDERHRLEFRWSVAMECLQKEPRRAYPALRPIVLVARRVADDAIALLDPLTGPIAEERATTFSITKKLRAQIDHIRSVVNQKCDAIESEMRSVQTAIIKAQSQTMSLVRNLASIGGNDPSS